MYACMYVAMHTYAVTLSIYDLSSSYICFIDTLSSPINMVSSSDTSTLASTMDTSSSSSVTAEASSVTSPPTGTGTAGDTTSDDQLSSNQSPSNNTV